MNRDFCAGETTGRFWLKLFRRFFLSTARTCSISCTQFVPVTSGPKAGTPQSRNWRQKLVRHLPRECRKPGATLTCLYGRSLADLLPVPPLKLYFALDTATC